MKNTAINFRCDQYTRDRFEKLILVSHKNKQDLMNDLIDSYLLLNNDEQRSLDKKISHMIDLLNNINEYVQLPAKCYGGEFPHDLNEMMRLVRATSKYQPIINEKIYYKEKTKNG